MQRFADLPGTIRERFQAGKGWVEIQQELGVDRYAVFSALRDQIMEETQARVVELYREGKKTKEIETDLDLRERYRCGGPVSQYIVTRVLCSLPTDEFIEMNEAREGAVGNRFSFDRNKRFDRQTVLSEHRRGLRIHELANIFDRPAKEIRIMLGIEPGIEPEEEPLEPEQEDE